MGICKSWNADYPYPSLTNPNNSYCTEDRTQTSGDKTIKFITVPHFCSEDSNVTIKRNFCSNIGDTSGEYIDDKVFSDQSEWEYAHWATDVKHTYSSELAPLSPNDSGKPPQENNNRCDYNDEEKIAGTNHLGRLVTGGCCNGCGIAGSRLQCRRKNYNADPIICCLNDYENTQGENDCWQTSLKQRTCSPDYRNLGSNNCGDILKQYCLGTAFFPEQSDWKQLWSYNSSIDLNILQQSNPSVTYANKLLMRKVKEQPCLQVLARQLVGDIYSDGSDSGTVLITKWEDLENMILTNDMVSKSGRFWGAEVVNGIIDKYNEESGGFIGSLDTDSFATDSNFVKVIYDICSKFPFLCQDSLTRLCKQYTKDMLVKNPNIITWCGCYLNDSIYDEYAQKYDISRECTPMCNNDNAIKTVDNDLFPLKCLESTCIIDDFSINLSKAINPGGITFNQVCNGCGKRSVKSNINDPPSSDSPKSTSQLTSISPFTYIDDVDVSINNIYWQFLKLNNGLFNNFKNSLCDTTTKLCSKTQLIFIDKAGDTKYVLQKPQDQDTPTNILVCFVPWDLYYSSSCDTNIRSGTTSIPDKISCIGINESNIRGKPSSKVILNNSKDIEISNLPYGLYNPTTGELAGDGKLNKKSIALNYGELVKIIPLGSYGKNETILENIFKSIIQLGPGFKGNYNYHIGEIQNKLDGLKQLTIPENIYNKVLDSENSNLTFWDLALANLDTGGGTGGDRGPSGSEGIHSDEISQCFCQFSGSLVVTDSFLGSANFKENCKSTKCVNSDNTEIPCGSSCTDDNGNPVPCNNMDPGDLPGIAKDLKKRSIINFGDNITIMILIFLIILVIIGFYFYKL